MARICSIRHRFKKAFRTISLDITGSGNINNGSGYTNSIDNFYQIDSSHTINQHFYDSLHSITLTPTLSYTEPLSKNMILQLNYSHLAIPTVLLSTVPMIM